MAYELADGSLSTDYEVGDEFVVNRPTEAHSKGDIIKAACIAHPEYFISGNYSIYWLWVTPTPETKRKAQARKGFGNAKLEIGRDYRLNIDDEMKDVKLIALNGDGDSQRAWVYNEGRGYRTTLPSKLHSLKRKVTLSLTDEQIAQLKTQLGIEV